jgi:SAM-dependent methyltransferase
MSKVTKTIARTLVHAVADPRKFYYRKVNAFAQDKRNKRILELGSGPLVHNKYYYSAKHLFDDSNDFVQSDINPEFGHPIVDATKMKHAREFDVILCLNVLEHVYEYQKAIDNIHKALKKGGTAVIAVPFSYPLHDEPGDYWRFTEHTLKQLLRRFTKINLAYKGKREFPFGYYVEATK